MVEYFFFSVDTISKPSMLLVNPYTLIALGQETQVVAMLQFFWLSILTDEPLYRHQMVGIITVIGCSTATATERKNKRQHMTTKSRGHTWDHFKMSTVSE